MLRAMFSSRVLVSVLLIMAVSSVGYAEDITIKASPSTLVLDDSCGSVTVHTNLDYDPDYTATINGVTAGTFMDDLGNLVARACILKADDIIPEELPATITVILVVVDEDNGITYTGTDTIIVKEPGPRPQPKEKQG